MLTFVILAGFASIVGVLTARQLHGQFNDEVRSAADQLQAKLNGKFRLDGQVITNCNTPVRLSDYAQAEHALIRIFEVDSGDLLCPLGSQSGVKIRGARSAPAPGLFDFAPVQSGGMFTAYGYRVAVRELRAQPIGWLKMLYARPLSDTEETLSKVNVFLGLGVLGGTILALLGGLWSAQRAMRPVAELTEAAREIERTRDPRLQLPHPETDDEVAELARTLEGMLGALDSARSEIEAMLIRQREFVADASHELRTPLTSVLANLELLTEELHGEQADSAQAALRATRRMRRLVGDLLLLARADAHRAPVRRPVDLGEVLTEAAAELGPMAAEHELSITPGRAPLLGSRDDLHRLVLNLLENAIRHTPPGTHVVATTDSDSRSVTLTVEDDGPGIPREIERRAFERFVRGGGDGGRGSGLGLAIVRAVAESHGGSVGLEPPPGSTGTRFVVRLPMLAPVSANGGEAQTSTTTGSTIGRRRSRS